MYPPAQHVLPIIRNERLLDSTLRFSFSVLSTPEEVDYALTAVDKVLPMLRRFIKK